MPKELLLLFNVLMLLVTLVLFVVLTSRLKRLKAAQERVISSLAPAPDEQWFRVNIATAKELAGIFKLHGFGAKGVMVIGREQVRLVAEHPSGTDIDRSFPRSGLQVSWLGNRGLGSANLHWLEIGEHEPLAVCADTGMNALQSREATADLYRRLRGDMTTPPEALNDFAIEKHPVSLTIVAVFGLLAVYALVDGSFLNAARLVAPKLINLLLLSYPIAIAAGIASYFWLSRSKVPGRESLVLSMLLSLAIIGAWVPAAKRLDQALAGPAQTHTYTLEGEARLEPVTPGLPVLKFGREVAYWNQFKTGSKHAFTLIHGPLGLWQLDTRELNEKTRAFYRERKD